LRSGASFKAVLGQGKRMDCRIFPTKSRGRFRQTGGHRHEIVSFTYSIDADMRAETRSLHCYSPENDIAGSSSATAKMHLLEAVRSRCREMHYSARTEQAYLGWAKRFLFFHGLRHPSELGYPEAEAFLHHLTDKGRVSPSTHNQTLSALHFLFGEVLNKKFPCPKKQNETGNKNNWQTVFSDEQSRRVLAWLEGTDWLLGSLLCQTQLKLKECLPLRMKDIDPVRHEISSCDSRGKVKNRIKLPRDLHAAMRTQMEKIREEFRADMRSRWQGAYLPEALAREYPEAGKSLAWQYVFPAPRLSQAPDDEKVRRYPLDAKVFLKALGHAAKSAGIDSIISARIVWR